MTTLRRMRKPPLRLIVAIMLGAVIACTESRLAQFPARAATSELVVVDRHTGLAISGYDPVAYFTDAAARPGLAPFEAKVAGTIWRFRNEGNRAAFVDDPDIYAPRFGGYDPTGIARGVAVAGDPRIWLISGGRLYLFYRPENRTEFSADSEQRAADADRRWPAIQMTLAP
jgi:hypothetical protein